MYEISDLTLYRGSDIPINNRLVVHNPRLYEIEEFDEQRYFQAVHSFCASGADLKWQLWDKGIDYTKIDDYDLFLKFTRFMLANQKNVFMRAAEQMGQDLDVSQSQLDELDINPMQLLLRTVDGDPVDLAYFDEWTVKDTDERVLYSKEDDITIDRFAFHQIVDALRKIHFLKRNNEIPGNKTTKMILIEDAREAAMAHKDEPFKSVIAPLLSGLTVKCGQCGNDEIWNMPIYQLLYNIKRALKIQDATALIQGAYSGFANLKGVDKNRFDWLGDI